MDNEEQVFDFMAAAEDTGQRLDLLMRQVPGHIKTSVATTLVDEWRKVTAFKELAEATEKLNGVIAEAREMVRLLQQTIRAAIIVGIIVTAAIPVIGWIVTNR